MPSVFRFCIIGVGTNQPKRITNRQKPFRFLKGISLTILFSIFPYITHSIRFRCTATIIIIIPLVTGAQQQHRDVANKITTKQAIYLHQVRQRERNQCSSFCRKKKPFHDSLALLAASFGRPWKRQWLPRTRIVATRYYNIVFKKNICCHLMGWSWSSQNCHPHRIEKKNNRKFNFRIAKR